jgi:hypothetical protein
MDPMVHYQNMIQLSDDDGFVMHERSNTVQQDEMVLSS